MADQDFPFIKTGLALSLAGGMIEGRSSRATMSTQSEAHKAQFQAWATSGTLANDVGMGMIFYGIYKRSPLLAGALGLGYLALNVMATKNPEKTLNAMERWAGEPASPPARTGWEPWEHRDWERRGGDWDRDRRWGGWDPHRFSRFGTLGTQAGWEPGEHREHEHREHEHHEPWQDHHEHHEHHEHEPWHEHHEHHEHRW
jgi:hypothetical protein